MNNIALTINLSADDRARLDKIIELLGQPTKPAPTPIEETPKEEVKITPELIQQKVIQLCATGAKKDKTREIVNAYAPKVSAIPEDKMTEVWEKLLALESEA